MNIIVAYDEARAIGRENELLWNLGEMRGDMKHFRELTMGTTIIMGRKTLESIGVALPQRRSIVVTHQDTVSIEGVEITHSLEEAVAAADGEANVIGGAQIYEQALSLVERVYATEVKATITGADAYFPAISSSEWNETDRQSFQADENNIYGYDFVTYDRK